MRPLIAQRAAALVLASTGHNKSQIAALLGVTWPSVDRWLKAEGVDAINGVQTITKAARNAEVVARYQAGATAAALAIDYGVSQARICMIIKRSGVVLRHRGRTPNGPKRPKAATHAERLLARLQAAGVDVTAFDDAKAAGLALDKFLLQRQRAADRCIGWEMTFSEWFGVWQRSGQWANRGRVNKHSAVMARRGDTGPYSVANVYITTLSKNFVDSHLFRGHRIRGEASNAAVLSLCPAEPLNTTQLIGETL